MRKISWELLGVIVFIGILVAGSQMKIPGSGESVLSRMAHDFGLGLVAVWEVMIKPALEWLF